MRERRACGCGAHAGAACMRERHARARVCGAQAGEARMRKSNVRGAGMYVCLEHARVHARHKGMPVRGRKHAGPARKRMRRTC
eukprot:3375051-Pleurochrysis_carterae.AAC.1